MFFFAFWTLFTMIITIFSLFNSSDVSHRYENGDLADDPSGPGTAQLSQQGAAWGANAHARTWTRLQDFLALVSELPGYRIFYSPVCNFEPRRASEIG